MHILNRLIGQAPNPISMREKLRSAGGALLGISLTGLAGSLVVGFDPSLPALIAPMGASAVLLFAVPSSPLAQPWSILGGNILSATVGVTVAALVPDPALASGLAIGIAIAAMMALRCLHPPSGAIALTAVLGGPSIHAMGYGFVLWPVLGNSLALLILAIIFNNLAGRRYPHAPATPAASRGTKDPPPSGRIGFRREDLDTVLKDYDQVLDIDRSDLETIIRLTELRSYRQRASHLTCADVMSRDVIAVSPDDPLGKAHQSMRSHRLKALPVTNEKAEVVGIVTQTDFLDKPVWTGGRPTIGPRQRLRLMMQGATAPNQTVRDIMTAPVRTIGPSAPLNDAVVMFAEEGLHYLPIVGENGKLAGILSQSDVLVALLSDRVTHAPAQHEKGA
jgi:CBS domain-containing membrane protein